MDDPREQVRNLIRQFVAQHNNVPPESLPTFDDHRDLFDSGDLDSFGFVELMAFLSDQTDRELDLADVDPTQLIVVGALLDHFGPGTS